MTDSTRGILTDADREFLQMDPEEREGEYTDSAISQRRNTIRRRVYHGIEDLELLFHHLPDKDRGDIFGEFEEGIMPHKRSQLLRYGAAFLLLGVVEEENVDLDEEEYYEHVFYYLIETVLHKAGGMRPREIDVDVTIEKWTHPNEGLAAVDPAELEEETLRYLLFDGQISSEEFSRGILNRDDE